MPVAVPARPRVARLVAVLAACGLVLLPMPVAYAQDPVDQPAPAESVTLGSRALGFGAAVPFQGNQDEVTVTVPVPQGLTPTSLEAVADLPGNVGRAWIDVESADRSLARVDLPGAPAANAPISIPLTGAEITDQAVAVTLRSTLIPIDNFCPEAWASRGLTLRDVTVRYSGAPTDPAVVADFLPPVLQQLVLYIPGDPTETESAAALDLAGAVVAYYGAQPVRVDVRKLPEGLPLLPPSGGPFERSVIIRESGEPATELVPLPGGGSALRLNGDDATLQDQVRLVTSKVAAVAVDARAIAGSMDRPPILAPTSTTLRNLGQTNLVATSSGRAEVAVGLDQSRLGRASGSLRVNLQGSYTPLPDDRSGLLSVTAGEYTLDSWAAEPSGVIDRWIDVPDDALRRVTTLTVALNTTGATNHCGTEQPVTLTIDPDSEVTSEPSKEPNPTGFQALPQSMLPGVDVAGTVGGFDDTARAVAVVTGLQSLTTIPLDPRWVSLDEAIESAKPAILIAADGALPDSVPLPLERTENTTLELTDPSTDESAAVTLGAPIDFASLQTTFDGKRQLVVAGSTGVPGELDRTLEWLHSSPDRWAGLDGDVLFTTADRDPVELSVPDSGSSSTSSGISAALVWVLAVGGALFLAGIVVAVVVLLRSRRSRTAPR
ncbi:hypothetical protein CBI38_24255 [Rhodococcus oxybenzonivorans]|uniref:Cellulose biosynthesis cyclic di-GMP-binding regulatory protein BcsB n=1 Tax=Rhodococcus oxybenzonivorans TaxID=1990687 RepID=A0A2S2C016_9NOCA|nr:MULTISPECIES: hypothetical protein [Rhodococcus]AWK74202.1 hypothetical protein CBI38_24255 [Rhodococcus oxybenzonivorans]QTJ68067.1 hypothetical protein HYG77_22455 [Rhodococcus sp. ZPP]